MNALYLLAGWLEHFREDQTVDQPFHGPLGSDPVLTTRRRREARYAAVRDDHYVALHLWLKLDTNPFQPTSTGSEGLPIPTPR